MFRVFNLIFSTIFICFLFHSNLLAQDVSLLGHDNISLSKKEDEAIRLSEEWVNRNSLPSRGNDGRVIFNYGSTLPSIICAPLQICDLELQEGEIVKDLFLGDTVRWKVIPGKSGVTPNEITHLIIKPSDVGISTTMVITTDRRTYNIKLISKTSKWMPRIAFAYYEEVEEAWASYKNKSKQNLMFSNIPNNARPEDLDFNYKLDSKKNALLPLRVYNDGLKTYIQMPSQMKQKKAPALLVLGVGNEEELVNYRLQNDTFIVDQIFNKAILVSGAGSNQQKVIITKKSK